MQVRTEVKKKKLLNRGVTKIEDCSPAKLQLLWQEAEGKNTMCLFLSSSSAVGTKSQRTRKPQDIHGPREVSPGAWGMGQEGYGEDTWQHPPFTLRVCLCNLPCPDMYQKTHNFMKALSFPTASRVGF